MLISKKDFLWSKLDSDSKELLFEFQHQILDESNNVTKIDTSNLKEDQIDIIIDYINALGYNSWSLESTTVYIELWRKR